LNFVLERRDKGKSLSNEEENGTELTKYERKEKRTDDG